MDKLSNAIRKTKRKYNKTRPQENQVDLTVHFYFFHLAIKISQREGITRNHHEPIYYFFKVIGLY